MKLNKLIKRSGNIVLNNPATGSGVLKNLQSAISSLSSDLSIMIDSINNYVSPALNGLAKGSSDDLDIDEDAYADGIMGKNIFVDRDSTSSSSPWLHTGVRPTTIKEAFSSLYSTVLSRIDDVETANEVISSYTKDYIGNEAFDSTATSSSTSIDGRLQSTIDSINTDMPLLKDLPNNKLLVSSGAKTPNVSNLIDLAESLLTINGGLMVSEGIHTPDGEPIGLGANDLQIYRDNSDEVASGDYSNISGGYANRSAGGYSNVSGGKNNKSDGSYSSVSNGLDNMALHDYSRAGGKSAISSFPCEDVWSSGHLDAAGDVTTGRFTMAKTTASTSPTNLELNGSNYLSIDIESSYVFDILVIGRRLSDSATFGYTIKLVISRVLTPGSVSINYSNITTLYEADPLAQVTVFAELINGGLCIAVQAPTNSLTHWASTVNYVKVK